MALIVTDSTYQRLKKRITEDGDCWMWDNESRRPVIYQKENGKYVCYSVREVLYLHKHKKDAENVNYISVCGSKRCVNPDHVVALKQQEFLAHIGSRASTRKRQVAAMSNTGHHKINQSIANDIRLSDAPTHELADKYKLSRRAIIDVRNGTTWRQYNFFSGLL